MPGFFFLKSVYLFTLNKKIANINIYKKMAADVRTKHIDGYKEELNKTKPFIYSKLDYLLYNEMELKKLIEYPTNCLYWVDIRNKNI